MCTLKCKLISTVRCYADENQVLPLTFLPTEWNRSGRPLATTRPCRSHSQVEVNRICAEDNTMRSDACWYADSVLSCMPGLNCCRLAHHRTSHVRSYRHRSIKSILVNAKSLRRVPRTLFPISASSSLILAFVVVASRSATSVVRLESSCIRWQPRRTRHHVDPRVRLQFWR